MPESRGPSPSCRSRRSRRRSSSRAVMVASRDSWRSVGERPGAQGLRQQRRRQPEDVLVAAAQSEVSGPESDDQLGAGAVEREGRACASTTCPRRPARPPASVRAAYGSTSASRMARSAGDRVVPDPAGHPAGGVERVAPAAEQRPRRRSRGAATWSGMEGDRGRALRPGPGCRRRVVDAGHVQQRHGHDEQGRDGDDAHGETTTLSTVTPRTSTISGSATTDDHGRADQGEDEEGVRQPRAVLDREVRECRQQAGRGGGERHPLERPPLLLGAGLDAPPDVPEQPATTQDGEGRGAVVATPPQHRGELEAQDDHQPGGFVEATPAQDRDTPSSRRARPPGP